ncbi:MAG: ParB N-terminal domain-containing protein [bacterium]|nr:ParB N-terminal domain-containing protein [bacterium]
MKYNITEGSQSLVNIGDINDQPGPYCMSFEFDPELLSQSIKRVGLINSPILVKNSDGNFEIVLGYRRIKAMKYLDWDKIPCRILSETELAPQECLLMNLNDNIVFREFNDIEKGMIIYRLSALLRKKEILEKYMPLIGLPSNEPTMIFYSRLEHELEEEIKASVKKGGISLHAVKMLLEMDRKERSQIFKWISSLRFNVNQQKTFIEYLLDISSNDKKPISEVLEAEPLKKIFADSRMNNPQKANAVIKELRSGIFPKLIHAEQTFKHMLSSTDLPKGVRINAPPFFEAAHYKMEILFRDGIELNDKLKHLTGTKGLLKLQDPWEKDLNV